MQVCYLSEALGSPHVPGSRDILPPHWKAHVHGVENCKAKALERRQRAEKQLKRSMLERRVALFRTSISIENNYAAHIFGGMLGPCGGRVGAISSNSGRHARK